MFFVKPGVIRKVLLNNFPSIVTLALMICTPDKSLSFFVVSIFAQDGPVSIGTSCDT